MEDNREASEYVSLESFGNLGKTREEFLTAFPELAEWVASHEALHGTLERVGALNLDENRTIVIIRFEKVWSLQFHNENNEKKEDKDRTINLKSDTLCAIIGMYECMKDPGGNDWETFLELLRRNYKDVLPS